MIKAIYKSDMSWKCVSGGIDHVISYCKDIRMLSNTAQRDIEYFVTEAILSYNREYRLVAGDIPSICLLLLFIHSFKEDSYFARDLENFLDDLFDRVEDINSKNTSEVVLKKFRKKLDELPRVLPSQYDKNDYFLLSLCFIIQLCYGFTDGINYSTFYHTDDNGNHYLFKKIFHYNLNDHRYISKFIKLSHFKWRKQDTLRLYEEYIIYVCKTSREFPLIWCLKKTLSNIKSYFNENIENDVRGKDNINIFVEMNNGEKPKVIRVLRGDKLIVENIDEIPIWISTDQLYNEVKEDNEKIKTFQEFTSYMHTGGVTTSTESAPMDVYTRAIETVKEANDKIKMDKLSGGII